VEIDADQPIVDRGPYRWVRHPSYAGVVLLAMGRARTKRLVPALW
jgi:protein-S-isoprenylcysteine O-methyltransferase Ste14